MQHSRTVHVWGRIFLILHSEEGPEKARLELVILSE